MEKILRQVIEKMDEEFEKELCRYMSPPCRMEMKFSMRRWGDTISYLHFRDKAILKAVEKIAKGMKRYQQCNPCFDNEHCKGKQMKCECKCVKNREAKIDCRAEEYNAALFNLVSKLSEIKP